MLFLKCGFCIVVEMLSELLLMFGKGAVCQYRKMVFIRCVHCESSLNSCVGIRLASTSLV